MAQAINITSGNKAILSFGTTAAMAAPGGTDGIFIPLVQDVTVSAAPGTVRYSTLDSSSSAAFTTTNENEVSFNMLVDEDTFFGNASLTSNSVAELGLLQTSINKTEVFFSIAFEGSGAGGHYLHGKGFIGGLAPTASIDAAVFLSPGTVIVNGEIAKATV